MTGRSLCGSGDRLIDRVTQFLQRRERPHRRLEASSREVNLIEILSLSLGTAVFYFEKKNGPHLCQLLVKSTLTFSIPDISRSSPRDPSLSGYLSTLKHPGRQRHSFQETCARYSGKIPTRSSTGWIGHRSTNPSPSAYGEWPGRINRKAGISFRRCGSVVPRLAVAKKATHCVDERRDRLKKRGSEVRVLNPSSSFVQNLSVATGRISSTN
ncbi:hypothetical protein ALC53_03772 [Atta colombica]|uniref:Uncharacterized protein n=1 Tax=Atta colombica TaxID=520822 RepID=A0A195BM44_9HYME|nr:hypothetical protein ALC53_03772 [Atta colombica]